MTNYSTETATLANVVPFLMVLFAISLLGFLFLVINGPLLVDLLCSQRYPTLGDLLTVIIARYKSVAPCASNFSLTIGAFFLSLQVGYVVQMISGSFASVFGLLLGWLTSDRLAVFSARQYATKHHGEFKIWLHENRASKLEWEWEFFNYCVYWGLFTNIVIFVILGFVLVIHLGWWPSVIGLFICLFLLINCMMRSYTMRLVHEACLAKAGIET